MKKVWMAMALVLVAMLAAGAMAQTQLAPMGKAAEWTGGTKSPGSILDSFAVYNGAATLRKCAISTKFKGASDDTIRVVAVQSAAPRRIRIMTDTSTVSFGAAKFRMDSCAYGLPSGATPNGLAVGDIDGDGVLDIVTA
ncbi:MAG TPA: VCBS repeat-containing protein, partial [Candidatus Edwardsbacteria bacterium]|nr:VCBS repeat-containing protein [Candidatus Edwardsbacteria bacterium]